MIPIRTRRWPRAAAAYLAALCAAALACTAAPAQSLLPGLPPPGCSMYPEKRPLPTALAELADTAGLAAALREHGLADPGAWVVLEVEWDSTGAPDSVRVAAAGVDPARAESVARLLRTRLTPQEPVRDTLRIPGQAPRAWVRGWSVLVRLDAGEPAAARFGWSEECVPALLDQSRVARQLNRMVRGLPREVRALLPRTVHLKMRVDTTGRVDTAEVARSTGVAALDQAVYAIVPELRFRPAQINRRTVNVWVALPINLMQP